MKNILIAIFLTISINGYTQTNGYSLEFDSTILMSLDTFPMPPINTVRIKQFTVPAGKIFKINAGYLRNLTVVTNPIKYIQKSTLIIGNNMINPSISTSTLPELYIVSFNTDNSIWVNSGETVTLKFESNFYDQSIYNSIFNCWVSGVLFRKIPN